MRWAMLVGVKRRTLYVGGRHKTLRLPGPLIALISTDASNNPPPAQKKSGSSVQLDITGQGFGKYQNQADSDQGCVDVEVQLHFLYHRCVCFEAKIHVCLLPPVH